MQGTKTNHTALSYICPRVDASRRGEKNAELTLPAIKIEVVGRSGEGGEVPAVGLWNRMLELYSRRTVLCLYCSDVGRSTMTCG